MCVHTELYHALLLKFMDIKMLQTTNSLNLKELKIMGFTVCIYTLPTHSVYEDSYLSLSTCNVGGIW